ncbi:MAG: glycosyl transferase family 39 [Okeania sp. SIO2C9]|uniref:glycosyltransferase family 39 protein n=1 Tax=Okeania sp. SIO2C9 TaxID=2607791 RepID=UPI0013C15105|nr:glycosyltransferase family 39 protein [Okeania sp. SIO2C9]NEQ76605.1 glycosyl transferase family 39 [Okeania sp. SIO2C9]
MIYLKFEKKNLSQILIILLIIAITLGIGFRFFNLDKKVYWHDEVYTSLRASGFKMADLGPEFINEIIPAQKLQKYQDIKPESTFKDTLESLIIENPHHSPLYYFIARFWMQQFGASIKACRSLPALISLLSLPLIYILAWQLFNSHLNALLATTFLALSPFEILLAQTARQYSLVTVIILSSSILLLKSLHYSNWKNWGLYIIVCAVGLYTHLFFGLTMIAQGVFVISNWFISNYLEKNSSQKKYNSSKIQLLIQTLPGKFFIATLAIIILYIPWILVIINNLQRAYNATNWARVSVGFNFLVKQWILSFSSLFIDLDFGFDSIATYLLRLPFLIIIGFGVYTVCSYCSHSTKLFILTSIFVPFAILVIPDLLWGGKRSAVTRYLISCFPAIYLSVAYLFSRYLGGNNVSHQLGDRLSLFSGQKFWRVVLAILLTASILSCSISAVSDTWWNKTPSYFNAEVAKKINASDYPLLLSDVGDDYTNIGDVISLSYLLDDNVQLLLLTQLPNLQMVTGESEIFVFRPSRKLLEAMKAKQWELKSVVAGELWRVDISN